MDSIDADDDELFRYPPGTILPVLIKKYAPNKRKISAERATAYRRYEKQEDKEPKDYILEDTIRFSNKYAIASLSFYLVEDVKLEPIFTCNNPELKAIISNELDLSSGNMSDNLKAIYEILLKYKPNNL